jgi:hypothetical protein
MGFFLLEPLRSAQELRDSLAIDESVISTQPARRAVTLALTSSTRRSTE